jgi:DNA-binding phage protein
MTRDAMAARRGVHPTVLFDFETSTTMHWLASTVQNYCADVGRRLALTPVGFPDLSKNPTVAMLSAMTPTDGHHLWLVVAQLEAARRAWGLSRPAVAVHAGVTGNAIALVEVAANPLLSTLQRVCRAVGLAAGVPTRLDLNLVEL